jgi:hypothetical protein
MQNVPVFSPFIKRRPNEVFSCSVHEIVDILIQQYGTEVYTAFDHESTTPSLLQNSQNTDWLKLANCVGVNVRTIGSFWNLLPYVFTLPAAQNTIHILPIWEPGVVASLYGMSSWNINPAFFSSELAQVFPELNTVEKQLKVVVNLLHLTGRVVGMDVVPHTDRYAEQVLANPSFFEWLQRKDDQIINHAGNLHETAAILIFEALQQMDTADPILPLPPTADTFFRHWTESDRLMALFGAVHNYNGRLERRKIMIQWLYDHGFETVPATMAPPYRGIEVDPNPNAMVVDEEGRLWRDYRIIDPQPMSRVFGPLARYRLYEAKDHNANWALDFEQPVKEAWDYVCTHYNNIAEKYNFDFMRGDMSHVQMRPDGVPAQPDAYYDLLGAVKTTVLQNKPYFGYFAESFMAAPGEMAFGDEYDHLEASLADTTLGDLQSEPMGTTFFVKEFARYVKVSQTRKFIPNFTIMTADKDDPRFDQFYLDGNEIRYFIGLFFEGIPSYMALGFECRDPHPEPVANEYYTKLYVFQLQEGAKATRGPYQWGNNMNLYQNLVRQKIMYNQLFSSTVRYSSTWVLEPDANGERKYIIWKTNHYLFVANMDTKAQCSEINLDEYGFGGVKTILFSTKWASIPPSKLETGKLILDQGEGLILDIP